MEHEQRRERGRDIGGAGADGRLLCLVRFRSSRKPYVQVREARNTHDGAVEAGAGNTRGTAQGAAFPNISDDRLLTPAPSGCLISIFSASLCENLCVLCGLF